MAFAARQTIALVPIPILAHLVIFLFVLAEALSLVHVHQTEFVLLRIHVVAIQILQAAIVSIRFVLARIPLIARYALLEVPASRQVLANAIQTG